MSKKKEEKSPFIQVIEDIRRICEIIGYRKGYRDGFKKALDIILGTPSGKRGDNVKTADKT